MLHGCEARHAQLGPALVRASAYLTGGKPDQAQQALDLSRIDRLSPEGDVLMRAVAEDLGISPIELPVGTRSAPWGIANLGVQIALFRQFGGAALEFEKSNENGWPGGAPDSKGGEYAPANSGGSTAAGESDNPRVRIGGNSDGVPDAQHDDTIESSFDDMPDIPETEPAPKIVNALLKSLGIWLIKRGVVALIPGVGEAAAIVQLGVWLYKYLPYLDAYIQSPQSLQDLQDAANDPQPGYQIHHIVEQTPARNEGYPNSQIEAPENLVRISTLKHWQIPRWYSKPNPSPKFGGKSPRDYLRGKSWAERVEVGHQALIDFGVLKE